MKWIPIWYVLVLVVVAACAARPVLQPGDRAAPAGVDLSGRWELKSEEGVPLESSQSAERLIRLPRSGGRDRAARGIDKGSLVRVFLETGESLKITQTRFSLFISFDRAIVEEFTFGENRGVAVGPISGQRVSGWTDDAFVIETMDSDGVILTERWRLVEGGGQLLREIRIMNRGREELATRQLFVPGEPLQPGSGV